MINAILGIVCIGAIAAFFVMWSKYDEQKKLTQEECEKRWQETSIALTVEKEKDAEIAKLNSCINTEIEFANQRLFERRMAEERCDRLQDKLSAILCPTNNHVWKDGVCAKCGRVYNG